MKKALFTLLFISGLSAIAQPLWLRYPSISPNGESIAFNYQGDIFIVDVKGGDAFQLTTNAAHDFMPIWSPDGSKIAFASNRNGNFDVFIVDAKGGTPFRLSYHSSHDYPYDFTPDGSSVIYGASRLDNAKSVQFPNSRLPEVYQVSIKAGKETQFMTVAAEDVQFNY
jgi:Tol biopolymer transport system component